MKARASSLLAALCLLHLSACGNQDEKTRAKIDEVAATGRQAAQAVGNYMKKHGRAPAHIEAAFVRPKPLKDIKLMSVDRKTGLVQVVLAFPPVEGKSLLFVPSRKKDKSVSWRCTSEDIEPKYLPAACQ